MSLKKKLIEFLKPNYNSLNCGFMINPYKFSLPLSDLSIDTNIAFSTTSQATSRTVSVTVGNNLNRLLLVWIGGGGVAISNGTATYNGVSMTRLAEGTSGSPYYHSCQLYYLVAPSTGTNNLTVTQSGDAHIQITSVVSLYGAKQSAPTIYNTTGGFSSNVSTSLTPTTAKDWLMTAGRGHNQASTNQPLNLTVGSGSFGGYHTTPSIGSSNSITFTLESSQPYGAVAVVVSNYV